MQSNTPTVSTVAKETGALILLFGCACIPSIGQTIALSILIVMAFGRPAMTFKSLVAGTTVTLITLVHIRGSSSESLLQVSLKWILLFAVCARCLTASGEPTKIYGRLLKYWGLLTGLLLINSLFVSAIPSISCFKAISFSLGLISVIRLAMLTTKRNAEMLLFISEMGTAVVVLSIPLLPLDVGWAALNGAYFNGILLHPQALGVFLVITGAASFVASFKLPNLERELIVCGLAQWSMIYFTKCRTALFAILLAGIVYIIEVFIRGGKSNRIRFVSTPAIVLTVSGLLLATMLFPEIRLATSSFLRKGDESTLTSPEDREEALGLESRGRQIFDDIDLMEEHPIFGYGFGIDQNSEKYVNANSAQLMGIPLSAPVEQGFLPLAIVAQIGLIGALFILPFLVSLYGFARQSSAEDAALFVAVLGVNFGEMIFFSFGSMGVLVWVMLVFISVSGTIPRKYNGVPVR